MSANFIVTSIGIDVAAYDRMMRRPASVVMSLLLSTALLQAQTVAPGGWENVDALPPGRQLILTLKSGERMTGAFQNSSLQDLVLTALAEGEHRVPKVDVREVVSETKDKIVDGLFLGAAIGAGAGALWGYSRRNFQCEDACALMWGVIMGAPVGALFGWLRDRNHKQTEVLYQAP